MSVTRIQYANKAEWLEIRKHYIGGSDAAAAVGLNAYTSAYTLWAEKTNRVPSFAGNLATEVGTYLEEFVAKKFEEQTGKKVRRNNRILVNSDYPFACADVDREVVGEDAGLEIKTTSELNTRKFKNGDYPANYYCQCMHYMAVTGKSKWYLAVLIGNRDFKIFEIDRDEAEISALMSAEEDLYNHIINDTPPAVDGIPSTGETISTLYPKSDDDAEPMNLVTIETDLAEYMELDRQIKSMTERKDTVGNRIKAYMKDAPSGYTEIFSVSYKSQERSTFDSKKFAAEHTNIDLSSYYNKSTSRPFKVSERKK